MRPGGVIVAPVKAYPPLGRRRATGPPIHCRAHAPAARAEPRRRVPRQVWDDQRAQSRTTRAELSADGAPDGDGGGGGDDAGAGAGAGGGGGGAGAISQPTYFPLL
jgi:hypothetical protein